MTTDTIAAPSVQWPAVRNSVGDSRVPLQRHKGSPVSSWATISPT